MTWKLLGKVILTILFCFGFLVEGNAVGLFLVNQPSDLAVVLGVIIMVASWFVVSKLVVYIWRD